MKIKKVLLGSFFALTSLPMLAQMDASIKLNEVITQNETNLIDEHGTRNALLEIANISHSTYNIRGMYVTTDRSVLDKKMSVPERVKLMSQIPNGDERTNLSGQQLIVFQLGSQPNKGALHLSAKVNATAPTWIALSTVMPHNSSTLSRFLPWRPISRTPALQTTAPPRTGK